MLGIKLPERDAAVDTIRATQRADGGFAEAAGARAGQTSTTAAAIGFLSLSDALADGSARPGERPDFGPLVSDGGAN